MFLSILSNRNPRCTTCILSSRIWFVRALPIFYLCMKENGRGVLMVLNTWQCWDIPSQRWNLRSPTIWKITSSLGSSDVYHETLRISTFHDICTVYNNVSWIFFTKVNNHTWVTTCQISTINNDHYRQSYRHIYREKRHETRYKMTKNKKEILGPTGSCSPFFINDCSKFLSFYWRKNNTSSSCRSLL